MYLTDTHSHLHFDSFADDLPQVLQRAREAGVRRILTLGTEPESSRRSAEIAGRYPEVYAAAGIHPTDVHRTAPGDEAVIRELARQEKVVAVGEIGLDLYWKEVPLADQLPVLEKMLRLAEELALPVVIHNRDAQPEMRDFFTAHGIEKLRGVMHSFAGSPDDAEFYLRRGLLISFTGVITFRNFKETEVVKSVPPEKLLLETDSPFLAPEPGRGKRNEPALVRHTARYLANLHEMAYETLLTLTACNARELFGWDEDKF